MLHNRGQFESWLPACFDGEFDWDFFEASFKGTKIQPMDIDAVVERNGHVLKFETKGEGTSISLGQAITLTNEWRMGSSILHLEGKSPIAISAMALYREGEHDGTEKVGDRRLEPCDAFDVIYTVRRWFCWASGWKIPSREEWDTEIWIWDYERNMDNGGQ